MSDKLIISTIANYTAEEIPGEKFGHPDSLYALELRFDYSIIDDSDYNRYTGYGKYTHIMYDNTIAFHIIETNDIGIVTRTEAEIEKNEPELYNMLHSFAKEEANNTLYKW